MCFIRVLQQVQVYCGLFLVFRESKSWLVPKMCFSLSATIESWMTGKTCNVSNRFHGVFCCIFNPFSNDIQSLLNRVSCRFQTTFNRVSRVICTSYVTRAFQTLFNCFYHAAANNVVINWPGTEKMRPYSNSKYKHQ